MNGRRSSYLLNPLTVRGRINRAEYGLALTVWTVLLLVLPAFAGYVQGMHARTSTGAFADLLLWLVGGFMAVLVMSTSYSIRRLHDIGYSGWWYLLTWLPWVGIVAAVLIGVMKSDPAENRWGVPTTGT